MGRELQWATTAEGDGRPQQSAGWTERTDAPAAAPRVGRPVEPPAAQGAGALREGAAGRRPAGGEPGRGGWAAGDGRRAEAEQCGRRGEAGGAPYASCRLSQMVQIIKIKPLSSC